MKVLQKLVRAHLFDYIIYNFYKDATTNYIHGTFVRKIILSLVHIEIFSLAIFCIFEEITNDVIKQMCPTRWPSHIWKNSLNNGKIAYFDLKMATKLYQLGIYYHEKNKFDM